MNKVPVGASIAHAYEFLFGRFFQIIGTAWVPAVLYGLGYYVFITAMPQTAPVPGQIGATVGIILGYSLLALVFFLVIQAVIGISLTQEALGVRKDLTLAHFVIGPRELRLFFAYLRFYLVFILLYVVVIAVCVGAIVLAKTYGSALLPKLTMNGMPIAVLAAAILAIILVVWFALSMMRLVFLLAPVAATEHRTRLSRAWALTRGSTLRILAVLVVTFLPVAIAFGVAAYYLIGPGEFSALMQAMHHLKPGVPPPTMAFMAHHAPMLSLIVAVEAAINGALLAGASATAYRAVTGHEDPEPEDDAALVAPLLEPVAEDDHGHQHGHHEEPAPSHDDHGHGGKEEHADDAHGHDDHGHGGHDTKSHDAADGHDDEDDDADADHAASHDDHASGHDDHGHGGDHDHGHGDHGHGGHGDGHHARPRPNKAPPERMTARRKAHGRAHGLSNLRAE